MRKIKGADTSCYDFVISGEALISLCSPYGKFYGKCLYVFIVSLSFLLYTDNIQSKLTGE